MPREDSIPLRSSESMDATDESLQYASLKIVKGVSMIQLVNLICLSESWELSDMAARRSNTACER